MEGTEFQTYVDRLEQTADIFQNYKSISKELVSLNKQLQHLLVQQKQQMPALQLCGQFNRFSSLFLKYADLNVQLRKLTPNAPLCLPDFTPGPKKFTDGFLYTRQQLDNLMVWTGYMDYSRIQKWYEQRLAKVPERRTLVELQIGCSGDRFIEMFHFYVRNRVETNDAPLPLTLEPDYVRKQCVKVALGPRHKTHQVDPGELSLRVQFGDAWKVPRKFAQKEVCGYTMDEKVYYMHIQQQKIEREKQEKQHQVLSELVQSRIGRRSSAGVSPPGTAAVSRSTLISSGSLGPLPPIGQKATRDVNEENKELTIRWVTGGTVSEQIKTETLQENVYDQNAEEFSDQYATDDLSKTRGATMQDDIVEQRTEKVVKRKGTDLKERSVKVQKQLTAEKEVQKNEVKEVAVQTMEWETVSKEVEKVGESVQNNINQSEKTVESAYQTIAEPQKQREAYSEQEKLVYRYFFDVPHFYAVILPKAESETQINAYSSISKIAQQSEETAQNQKLQDIQNVLSIQQTISKTEERVCKFIFDVPHFYNVTPVNTAVTSYKEIVEKTMKNDNTTSETNENEKQAHEAQEVTKNETQNEKQNAYALLANSNKTENVQKARSIEQVATQESQQSSGLTGYTPAGTERQIYFDIPYFYCPGTQTQLSETTEKVQKQNQNNICYFVDYEYESTAERHERIINELKSAGVRIVTDEFSTASKSAQNVKQNVQVARQEVVAPRFDLPYFYCYYCKAAEQSKKADIIAIAENIEQAKAAEEKPSEIANAYQIIAGK